MSKYNIKLFVHGVPNGQDVWGSPNIERNYIETFYGRQSSVNYQMFVEVMQFGNDVNTYFTYYTNNNIQEKEGRSGSYFALTLRINYYYADVQNIYNLLEAAFNKYVLGTILEQTKDGFRFLIAQLNQADNSLKDLEKEIEHYLMQFSSDSDFISLNGFKFNGQEGSATINLLEATSSVITNYVKTKGRLTISPLYPTSKEQQIIKKAKEEIQSANSKAQQGILAAQKKAKDDIDAIQRQANQDIQNARKEKEDSINAIKNQYKETDKTVRDLKEKAKSDERKIADLSNSNEKLKKDLQNATSYQTKYENVNRALNEVVDVIPKINDSVSALKRNAGMKGDSSDSKVNRSDSRKNGKKSEILTKILLNKDSLIILLLIISVCLSVPRSCSTSNEDQSTKDKLSSVKKENEELKNELNTLRNEIASLNELSQGTSDAESLLKLFENARIDVTGISGNTMRLGRTYSVTINGGPDGYNGAWYSENCDILDNNTIMPKKTGSCNICYIVENVTVKSRTITVQQ